MGMAVVAALYIKKSEPVNRTEIQKLEQKQQNLFFKLMIHQTVVQKFLAENTQPQDRQKLMDDWWNQLDKMDRDLELFKGDDRIQKMILADYMGKTLPQLSEALMARDIYRDFHALHVKNLPIPESSPLLKMPAGELSRLKLYELQKKPDLRKAHEAKLVQKAMIAIGIFSFLFLLLLFAMIANPILFLILVYRMRKTGVVLFAPRFYLTLRLLPPHLMRALLESFILYLFFMLPVSMAISQSGVFQFFGDVSVQAFYLPLTFLIAVLYFNSIANDKSYFRVLLIDHKPSAFLLEMLWGIAGFIAIFPFALTVLLLTLQTAGMGGLEESARHAHPVAFRINENPLTIFILAVFVAPVLEEIMFRSFLYGYLRTHVGILPAALLTGMVFAALHPQGYLALPYLTVLGAGLCMLREMRPGIIAPVVTHMIVNGLAMVAALAFMRM